MVQLLIGVLKEDQDQGQGFLLGDEDEGRTVWDWWLLVMM